MDGDMNDIFHKLNSIISDQETADNLKSIINNFNSSSTNTSQASKNSDTCSSENDAEDSSSNNIDFDINTILKIKSVMDTLNSKQNDTRANLLLSLKPYLKDSKKEKIDQYIKFLKIASVVEAMNKTGGEIKNE